MNNFDLFISYNSRDTKIAHSLAMELKARGISAFIDSRDLEPGYPWMGFLEEAITNSKAAAILLGPHGMGDFQKQETGLAIKRQTKDSSFQVIPVLLPGAADLGLSFLSMNTFVDMRSNFKEEGDALSTLTELLSFGRSQSSTAEDNPSKATQMVVCPYRGLNAFREEDAALFFGRESFSSLFAATVKQRSLVAVTGSSGSGKSSAIQAGLIPRLRSGLDGETWVVIYLSPGDRPFYSIAAALLPYLEPQISEADVLIKVPAMAASLRGGLALRDLIARVIALHHGVTRMMLIIDQWEELYTTCEDYQESLHFIDAILESIEKASLSVVMGVRGDFYGRIADYRPLSDQLQGATLNLGSMTSDELRGAIEYPARQADLMFEHGLVDRIMEDLGSAPGQLPLLEFVLAELWRGRRNGLLLHGIYDSIGGVQGAIARRAEEILGKFLLTESEVGIRRLFSRLVRPGEVADYDSRRRINLVDVDNSLNAIVKLLTEARLLVAGWDPVTGNETIEVTHESLIHNWSRLRSWVDEDRNFLLWREKLDASLRDWRDAKQDKDLLLRGGMLERAGEILINRRHELNEGEQRFIDTSLRMSMRSRYVRYVIEAGFAFLAAVAILFWFIASVERNHASMELETSRRVSAFLMDLFKAADPTEGEGNKTSAVEMLERGTEKIGNSLEGQPAVRARLAYVMGAAYRGLGVFDRAGKLLTQADSETRRVHGDNNLEMADILDEIGSLKLDTGDYSTAESFFSKALSTRKNILGDRNQVVAASLDHLGVSLQKQGKLKEADVLLGKSLVIMRKVGVGGTSLTDVINDVAMLKRDLGNYAAAEPLFLDALNLDKKNVGPGSFAVAVDLNNLAQLHQAEGRMDEAESGFRESLRIRRELFGTTSLGVASGLNNLAVLLDDRGRFSDAESLYEESIDILRKNLDSNHPKIAISMSNLAGVLESKGDFVGAEKMLRRVLMIHRANPKNQVIDTAVALGNLGVVLLREAKFSEARAAASEALTLQERTFGTHSREVALTLVNLTSINLQMGDLLAAVASVDRSLLILQSMPPPQDAWLIGLAQNLKGAVMAKQGHFTEAEPLLLEGYNTLKEKKGAHAPLTQKALRRIIDFYVAAGDRSKAAHYKEFEGEGHQ